MRDLVTPKRERPSEAAIRQILLSEGHSLLTVNHFSISVSACASLVDPML